MNRGELFSLPPAMQLRIIVETLLEVVPGFADALNRREAPKPPRSPKYDQKVFRKGGFMWASEMDLESLRFWRARYLEGAASGGEYAEKDRKRADQLKFWIDWREAEPASPWSGERGREKVTAPAPSRKAHVYESKKRETETSNGTTAPDASADDGPVTI